MAAESPPSALKAFPKSLAKSLFRQYPGRGRVAFAADLAAALVLGGAFLWAAAQKLQDPAGTLFAVSSYRVLPETLTPWAALALPWLEIWAAFFAVVGPGSFRRAGAFILSAMLLLFMAFTAFNLARGLDFECGCFGAGGGKPGALFFLRDAGLLALGLMILFHGKIFRNVRAGEELAGEDRGPKDQDGEVRP
ncbi:MAG: hypothetical protein LBQ12_13850 [Deltaproteobacteria bacterium]|jgi:hypothetical protein|nr:hypothetical protein [Deltaproteobacteria bacterium]